MKENRYLKDIMNAAIFTALMAVLGWISIPFPFLPAPVTGQTFGVMLAGAILTKRQAVLSMATFILLGAIGIPVFSNGGSGLAYLSGPTGGFIIGFLIGAITISLLKGKDCNILRTGVACAVGGIIVVYAIGIPWLCYERTGNFISLPLLLANLAFIPGDILKVCIASIVSVKVRKHLKYLLTE
jgi:biotin transport system substrate-specific component